MDRIKRWLEMLHDRKISNDFDRLVIVLGEEGVGKSTFILESMVLWNQVLGRCPEGELPPSEPILNQVVFDSRPDFKEKLLRSGEKDPIAVMDAAHVLHRKEAMHGDQVDIEKTLLDIRIENFLIFLGYQDWSDVPDQLQRRRAKNLIRIPRRGVIRGYSRRSMDEKYESGSWPDADLEDTFPSLDGRDLWHEFNEMDHERKEQRLEDEQEVAPADAERDALAKVALNAVQPWDDDAGMTQKEAGRLVGYSRPWVAERVNEWRAGEIEAE